MDFRLWLFPHLHRARILLSPPVINDDVALVKHHVDHL